MSRALAQSISLATSATVTVAPRPVRFLDSSARVKSEMAGLKDYFTAIGAEFEPPR